MTYVLVVGISGGLSDLLGKKHVESRYGKIRYAIMSSAMYLKVKMY